MTFYPDMRAGLSGRCPSRPAGNQDPNDKIRWHCQSKFYTACSRIGAGWSSTVFAHESPTPSTGFDAENGLYLFALTVPFHCLQKLSPTRRRALIIDCHGHYTTAPK